jgi:hypothetical protein
MKNKFIKITSLFLFVFLSIKTFGQYGQMPPFTVQIEAITGTTLPALHSFAFAQSGDKWLIIGGRTNGLHGLNSSGGFPAESKNDAVIVIDTSTWTYYQADLNQLPQSVADPMRTTNMQYVQKGNYLYMVGGYGFDSVAHIFVTFPKLTAIHIDNMINAVINSLPIASTIRQVTDTNLAVCGGDLGMIGNNYYLCFGHNFGGRYSDPPTPLFTQVYSDQIKKFNLADDGTTITLSNYTYQVDTNNFHRRDLNVGPVIFPDGSQGLEGYGGVFQKDVNLPFREPIMIDSSGTATVNMGYHQFMSQYACANFPVYDSATQTMYNTFLGGISLYDYHPGPNTVALDTLVPFISDITTMTTHSNGSVEETVLPVQLPGLLGSNAKFVLNPHVASYSNGVIRFRGLPNTRTLVGYMVGGIHALAANFGGSTANDTVYRIFLTPDLSVGINSEDNFQNAFIAPNPSSQHSNIAFHLASSERVSISVIDIRGQQMEMIANEEMSAGNHIITINTSAYAPGIYFCRMENGKGIKTLKMMVSK